MIVCGNIYKNGIKNACLIIEDGKIVGIKKYIKGSKIDYGNAIIFPSAIDIHVHFREPGNEEKEDFFTGTRAASLAGVTCVFDMPNNKPPVSNKKIFEEKKRRVSKKACIDFALYGGIKEKVEEMDCIAYKLFLSKDNELFCENVKKILIEVKKRNKIVAIHAESEECIQRKKSRNLVEHEKNRGLECELNAIKKIVDLNKKIKAKVHICHVTSKKSIEIIKRKASFGVTLHHLLFSFENLFKKEGFGKVNPPLRNKFEREMLFEVFKKGEIKIFESDHAPHLVGEKENFEDAPCGMPGVDAFVPVLLYFAKNGMIDFKIIENSFCRNPAKLFGIKKGEIKVGNDADFMVIDLRKVKKIKPLSKCGWSPYEGMKCIYPMHVYLRGEKVVDSFEFVGEKGKGRMING
ncbi:MAG: dihydroorotase family protein [Thermoplasmatales archaeon]|nr:dihydroorotase family protein [Thermoplasmatales archaeon]